LVLQLGFFLALLYFLRLEFTFFQHFNQVVVFQDVLALFSLGLQQTLQNVGFQASQFIVHFGDLFDERSTQFFVFGPQDTDSLGEQVFFEPFVGHEEVDDSGFDERLGQLVGIGYFGAELDLEVCVHVDVAVVEALLHDLVARLAAHVVAFLHQQLVDVVVHLFSAVLVQDDPTQLDAFLDGFDRSLVPRFDHFELLGFVVLGLDLAAHFGQPGERKLLGVDDDGLAQTFGGHAGILDADFVGRQVTDPPVPDFQCIRDYVFESELLTARDTQGVDFVGPLFKQEFPKLAREGA